MTTINLGKTELNYIDEPYDPERPYVRHDTIRHTNTIYRCKTDSIGNPPTDSNFWMKVSSSDYVLTTRGDIQIIGDDGPERLPVGLPGQILMCDGPSQKPYWATPHDITVYALSNISHGNNYFGSFLMNDGTLRATGYNPNCYSGLGHTGNAKFPEPVTNFYDSSSVAKIWVGHCNTFVLLTNGDLYGCGYNGYGMLGQGDTAQRNILTKIELPEGAGIITDLTCGEGWEGYVSVHVLDSNGDIYSCGYNAYGQLGNGNTTQQNTFVKVSLTPTFVKIYSSCSRYISFYAIDNIGRLWVCGYNIYGQLGTEDNLSKNILTEVDTINAIVTANFEAVLAGTNVKVTHVACTSSGSYGMALILLSDGRLYSTGRNEYGQLGMGQTGVPLADIVTAQNTFQLVTGSIPNPIHVDCSGGQHANCAVIDENNDLWTWGYNGYGQLGNTNTINTSVPYKNPDFINNVDRFMWGGKGSYQGLIVRLTNGEFHACGYNNWNLGVGNNVSDGNFKPVLISDIIKNDPIIDFRPVGYQQYWGWHILTSTGRVFAVGYNYYGQLGIGTVTYTGVAQEVIF
jgi:alpha-tubulin suppressor-like RCC1 family protein